MRWNSPISLLTVSLASAIAAGCSVSPSLETRGVLADLPLFTNADGYATLNIRVNDARRSTQQYSQVTGADAILFTLSNTAVPSLLASTKTATASVARNLSNVFSGLRPGAGYSLRATMYNQTRATNTGAVTSVVLGDGVSSAFALSAGANSTVNITINSVNAITLLTSAFGNSVADGLVNGVVENDTIAIDTGVNKVNSPLGNHIEAVYHTGDEDGTAQFTPTPPTALVPTDGSNASVNWVVPRLLNQGNSSEAGTMCINVVDASGRQIAQKFVTVNIYKAATLTGITLN